MQYSFPSFILAYHSCDKEVGLKVLNGQEQLKPSTNTWDWLGHGIYFWEHNPYRAKDYADEVASEKQFAKGIIKVPFVLGAVIDLKRCLNLTQSDSFQMLKESYSSLLEIYRESGQEIPANKGFGNRKLDCAVLENLHKMNEREGKPRYNTVRGAFGEGKPVYEGATILDRTHIQICVRDTECIVGYFLPQPVKTINPSLYSQ